MKQLTIRYNNLEIIKNYYMSNGKVLPVEYDGIGFVGSIYLKGSYGVYVPKDGETITLFKHVKNNRFLSYVTYNKMIFLYSFIKHLPLICYKDYCYGISKAVDMKMPLEIEGVKITEDITLFSGQCQIADDVLVCYNTKGVELSEWSL